MAAIPYLYRRMRGLGVPESLAQLFADPENTFQGAAVADLGGAADLAATRAKVNELLAALRAAGLIEE